MVNCSLMHNSSTCNFQYSNFTTIPINPENSIQIFVNQNVTMPVNYGNLTQYESNAKIIFFMNASGKTYRKVIYSNSTKYN